MDTKRKTDTKTLIEVYDPAMCCSTGVCGPDVDDAVADFAGDVKWLKSQGIDVRRYNLGQEPEAFKMNPEVISRLQKKGTECLPLLLINGEIVSEGGYPARRQLTNWLTIDPQNRNDPATPDLLNALESAVIEGDNGSMRTVFQQAMEKGLSVQQLADAMQRGINNRQSLTRSALQTANELLGIQTGGCAPGSGCC
ncbi:arsenite efflux transporter metallochaperone ArsD [Rhodohalobacter sp. 8-1]|uniref:arsenite efflux transporter metallochaperone ArsD n=1 Tax=Rhodohalobacter sp. 8-1 TaxID=3131972 RepID=UPI0030EFA3A2